MLDLPVAVDLAVGAGLSVGIAVFTMAALRREAGLPVLISAMVVPVVVAVGFGVAYAIEYLFALSLIESAGILGVALFWLVVLYELNYSPVVRE